MWRAPEEGERSCSSRRARRAGRAALFALAVVACAGGDRPSSLEAPPPLSEPPEAAAPPVGSDSALERRVRDALDRSLRVAADGVGVDVEQGVATLSGSVGSTAERVEAARIAAEAGAREVVNRLEVDGGSGADRTAMPGARV